MFWRFGHHSFELSTHGLIVGIVNVTPDSFSDGGRFVDRAAALSHARRLLAEGAGIIDVGGESTRPGARPTALDEELERVIPVIEVLRRESPVGREELKSGAVSLQSGAKS